MTDQTTPERGAEQPSDGLPIPKLEKPSSDSSPSVVDIDAIAKQVAAQIQRDLRMAQSTKDKEIAAIKKKLEISDLSELEAMGASIPENVKLEYRFRQLEGRQTDNSPVQQTSSPGNGAVLTAQDVSDAVRSFNLNANDADVIEALRGTYRNRDHFEASLAKLAIGKANKPQSSAAESASLAASAGTTDKSPDALVPEYIQKMRAARGNKTQLSAIREDYLKKGVKVWEVDFS